MQCLFFHMGFTPNYRPGVVGESNTQHKLLSLNIIQGQVSKLNTILLNVLALGSPL